MTEQENRLGHEPPTPLMQLTPDGGAKLTMPIRVGETIIVARRSSARRVERAQQEAEKTGRPVQEILDNWAKIVP